MSGLVFVDSNVLVYCRDTTEPEKQARAQEWMALLWSKRGGRVSFQVLQEFYITVTAKLRPGLDAGSARADVRSLLTWQPVGPDAALLEAAWRLQDRYSLHWWDAQIVAAARAAGAARLLTEDLQDGQDFGGVRVVDPFAHPPAM